MWRPIIRLENWIIENKDRWVSNIKEYVNNKKRYKNIFFYAYQSLMSLVWAIVFIWFFLRVFNLLITFGCINEQEKHVVIDTICFTEVSDKSRSASVTIAGNYYIPDVLPSLKQNTITRAILLVFTFTQVVYLEMVFFFKSCNIKMGAIFTDLIFIFFILNRVLFSFILRSVRTHNLVVFFLVLFVTAFSFLYWFVFICNLCSHLPEIKTSWDHSIGVEENLMYDMNYSVHLRLFMLIRSSHCLCYFYLIFLFTTVDIYVILYYRECLVAFQRQPKYIKTFITITCVATQLTALCCLLFCEYSLYLLIEYY